MRFPALLVAVGLAAAAFAWSPAHAQVPRAAAQTPAQAPDCPNGFTLTATACVLKAPANAVPIATGGWRCGPGFYESGDQCLRVAIPAGAVLSTYGHMWVCTPGLRALADACVPETASTPAEAGTLCGPWDREENGRCFRRRLPPHARRIAGGAWMCKPGFQENDGKCVPTQIPRYARLDAGGDGWICRRGYQPIDNKCVPIDVPNNASLGYFGDVWTCNRGYYEIRGVCLPDTAEHKALMREQAALAGRAVFQASEPVPPKPRIRRRANPYSLALVGLVGVIAGSLVIFFQLRDPPRRQSPSYRMSYVPRARGSIVVAAKWLSFGNRVDALTGAPILAAAQTAQCRNCRAWYHAESMMTLRQENEARCVACGRTALALSAA